MKKVIIVYSCDEWHTNASKEFFGVYSTNLKAIRAIKKADENVKRENVNQLQANNQTQGLDQNYILDSAILNQ